jgi:DNA-binding NarL/FixJ family response regulator
VDDNPEIIEAIRIRLAHATGYLWAGSMRNTDGIMGVVRSRRPDVILLDVDLPGPDPFDVVSALAAEYPDPRVIMLSGLVRKDLVNRAIKAGAWGYVAKSDGEQALLDAIDLVASGEFVMSAEVRVRYAL